MLVWKKDSALGFIAGISYLAFCGVVGPALVIRQKMRGLFEQMTAREWLLWPYCPLFLSPVFLGSAAAALDWKADEPHLRYTGIGLMFVAAVPAFLLFLHLCEGRPK